MASQGRVSQAQEEEGTMKKLKQAQVRFKGHTVGLDLAGGTGEDDDRG